MKLTKLGVGLLAASMLGGCGDDPAGDVDSPAEGTDGGADDDLGDDDVGDDDAPADDDVGDDDAPGDDDLGDDDVTEPPDAGPGDGGIPLVGTEGTDGGEILIDVPDGGVDAPTITISGQIRVSDRLFLDKDVKNIDVLVGSNGSEADDAFQEVAQDITSPCQVAGYLGPSATAEDDETKIDNVDYYKVQLEANQPVTLVIAEPGSDIEAADLELYLLDENSEGIQAGGTWVTDSLGIGDKEQVIAPATGTYWIAVERYQDSDGEDDDFESLYTLSVGILQSSDMQEEMADMMLSTKYEAIPNQVYVETSDRNFQVAGATTKTFGRHQLVSLDDGGPAARGSRDARWLVHQVKKIAKRPGVEKAFPNYVYKPTAAPNDPLHAIQWHYDQIDMESAWDNTDLIGADSARGAGVVVAVIDTGVAMDHEDFVNADGSSQITTDGHDMISLFGQDDGTCGPQPCPDIAVDGDGIDANPDDPGDGRTPGDHSFHGTHCSGTIAAATDNGRGGSGVAPKAHIMALRALGKGGGTTTDIAESIRYAAGLENASGEVPAQRADIISMSLGGPRSDVYQDAIDAARAAGVIVIAAAGNEASDVNFVGPASHDGVVAVSAVDFNRELAFYSNFGTAIDVAAPGGDTGADANLDGNEDGVISMVFKNEGRTLYAAYQGTSMATPHVAGVAALMKSVWKDMTPEDFDRVLASGELTIDVGSSGRDDSFGVGLINANKAVIVAAREAEVDLVANPVIGVSTTVLDFGGDGNGDTLALNITNNGAEATELTIDNIMIDQSWLTLTPGEEGENVVTVDRMDASIQDGVNSASITIESSGGTATVDVRLFKGLEPAGGDLDILYIMLVDPISGEAKFQEAAFKEEGEYEYTLPDVTPGKYYLVAGSDLADTLFLGNDGNAYGAFPLAQDPLLLCVNQDPDAPECREHVAADRSDVNFGMQILTDKGAEFEDDPNQEETGVRMAGASGWRIKRLW
jgi:serine protease